MLDSTQFQGLLRKVIIAVMGFMLALVLLVALLLAGFLLLLKAATLGLEPWLGEAGAVAVTGFSCLAILGLVFAWLSKPAAPSISDDGGAAGSSTSPLDMLRNLIRENPLEAACTAFALGVVEQGDTRLKSLLLQGGMVLMQQAEAEQATAGRTGSAASDGQSAGTGSEATDSREDSEAPGSDKA